MADPSITIGNQIIFWAAELFFLVGFLINVFIVAVNISGWKKRRPLSIADKVITSLGISKMVFQVVCLLNGIWCHYLYRLSFLYYVPVKFLAMSSICSTIWLSTLLSIVFCLKISTLHNAFFLWLKSLVLNRASHLILLSVVMSVSYALVYCLIDTFQVPHNSTYEMYNNVLFGLHLSGLIFLTTTPFLIYYISSVLLIIYLYHHISRMRSVGNGTSHLDIYYKTIKFTAFSVFSSAFSIIADHIFSRWRSVFGFLGLILFWQIFPTLQSMYLIYVTAKLRIQVSHVVHLLRRRCCVTEASVETVSY